MTLTNPPFTRQQGQLPVYLRDLTDEEMAQWQRMRSAYEQLGKQPTGGQKDEHKNVPG